MKGDKHWMGWGSVPGSLGTANSYSENRSLEAKPLAGPTCYTPCISLPGPTLFSSTEGSFLCSSFCQLQIIYVYHGLSRPQAGDLSPDTGNTLHLPGGCLSGRKMDACSLGSQDKQG